MNAAIDTFFAKFEELADDAEALSQIRSLILRQAFSGVFSNEPRTKAIPELLHREDAPQQPLIPQSWDWTSGEQVFDVIRGVSYKKHEARDNDATGYLPLLRANNIGTTLSYDGLVFVPSANVRPEQLIRQGDIIIAMSSGSKKLVGKAAPALADFNGAFEAFCGLVRSAGAVHNPFLAWYFKSPHYTEFITTAGKGIGINNLKKGDLLSLPIPLPPLTEQKRIVAKVDALMAQCDRLEAQLRERDTRQADLARAALARFSEAPTPENLDLIFHDSFTLTPADLRKTILTLAVQGKLDHPTTDDGDVPSLSDFRNASTKLALSLGLRAPKDQPKETEPPFEIPAHWRWMPLAELGAAQTGTTPSKNDKNAFGGDIPFIKPADILPNTINYSNESLTRYGAESGSRLAPAGTLLMVCIGTIGKCNVTDFECAFNQQINSLSPVQWIDSRYLLIAVRESNFQEAAWRKSSSTTIAILNKGKWLSIPVPIPPLAEQRRIVAKVDQLMALVDKWEACLEQSRTTATRLLDALVAELTNAQNPSLDPLETPA